MSISNELSSDLAAALLTEKRGYDPTETRQLVAIVAEVHSTLRHLTAEERKGRRPFSNFAIPPVPNSAA